MKSPEEAAEDGVRALLSMIETDSGREGLRDTPARVVRALMEMTSGYNENPATILATTFDGGTYDQMIVLRDIPFTSLCEHHMLPFTGVAHVAYVPGERVVGLSKLARVTLCFARRLQLQERLTTQVADAIDDELVAKGVGVKVEAHHQCMSCRGVGLTGATMITSALRGVIQTDPAARAEFLRLVNGK